MTCKMAILGKLTKNNTKTERNTQNNVSKVVRGGYINSEVQFYATT